MDMRKGLTFFLGPFAIFVLIVSIAWLGGRTPSPLPPPWAHGRLHVTTRPNLLGNPEPGSVWPGMEYALLRSLAEDKGWRIRFHEASSFGALFHDLEQGRAHLAAANLSMSPQRLQRFLFTRPIDHSRIVVLTHAARRNLRSWQDLDENTSVLQGSIFETLLREHGVSQWKSSNGNVLDLLDQIENAQISATLLDENLWLLFKPFFPNIHVAFRSEQALPIGWALPVNATGLALRRQINQWLAQAEQIGLVERLRREYLAPGTDYDPAGTFYFRKLVRQRLPLYRPIFQQVGEMTGLDWRLLAAMAYQESHWNPRARSHTGVRGLMMLTQVTARELGVDNRLDSEESVLGAARYLKRLIQKFPARIPYDHRVWFALGAYNLGFRHMENARRLAQHHGANPDDWFAVKPWLMRLNEMEMARKVDAWPADGQQAAQYVSNIQLYYRFLLWESVRAAKRD